MANECSTLKSEKPTFDPIKYKYRYRLETIIGGCVVFVKPLRNTPAVMEKWRTALRKEIRAQGMLRPTRDFTPLSPENLQTVKEERPTIKV